MRNKQIANIMFFSRAITAPDLTNHPKNLDRFPCTENQLNLIKEYDVPFTYLLDYNSIIDKRFKEKLSECPKAEIGAWFEIVKPMAEKLGIEYSGREGFVWDWHCNVSFPVGYSLKQREAFVDIFMDEYKKSFGDYPKMVGSWLIDAYTLNYMYENYHIEAACICREQWGTDGITLWGGHFGQGYYPSKNNILCPASTKQNQINVPVFRMLGSCPIYQYDAGLSLTDGPAEWMGVITLEPVYKDPEVGGGGVPEWVDWYLKENFKPDTLQFNYTHIGQENTMGWNNQKDGTIDQLNKITKMAKEGKVVLQTLLETAREYKESYKLTPATSVTALDDWKGKGTQSFWYECRNYRINCYKENKKFWIRDITLFREDYPERYRQELCTTNDMYFDNLPVIDGNRWSGGGIRAGIYPQIINPLGDFEFLEGETEVSYAENTETVTVKNGETCFKMIFTENEIEIVCSEEFRLVMRMSERGQKPQICNNQFKYRHNGFDYEISVAADSVKEEDNDIVISSANKKISLLV